MESNSVVGCELFFGLFFVYIFGGGVFGLESRRDKLKDDIKNSLEI